MQDNMNNVGFEKVEIDKSEFEEKIGAASIGGADIESDVAVAAKKKRVPVGGIIMGVINIIMSAPVAVLFFITVASMLAGAAIISNPDISVDAADNALEVIVLGFLQLFIMVFAIGLSFAIALGGTIATVIASIPSLIFFIVARFNRSKFFKITSVIVSLMTAAACIIVIGACVLFVVASRYGLITQ